MNTALVVGANGVIGTNLINHLKGLDIWNIIGLSRRGGTDHKGLSYISVDLLDKDDCMAKLGALSNITHIFYTAYQDRPTWAELVAPNLAMLANVLDAIEPIADLRHVSLMQGYKVYGAHYGQFKTPAKESDDQLVSTEFNLVQQNFLQKRQMGKDWSWSAIRPSVVGGTATGNPMNLAMAIAVYASLSKELGIPLRFPGKPGAYDKLLEMTDSDLLAKATVWAATSPQCANQAFNISNGDLFRWNDLWPKIAAYFDMPAAFPLPLPLAQVMADKEAVYENIQDRYSLEKYSYRELSSWSFADFVFSWDYDFLGDGSKARRYGFHEFVDTEKMFYRLFDEMRTKRIIP